MKIKQRSKTLVVTLGPMVLGFSVSTLASAGPTINVTMLNSVYDIKSGASSGTMKPGFTMQAGEEDVTSLKNEDATAHDFVSKAFRGMDVEAFDAYNKLLD